MKMLILALNLLICLTTSASAYEFHSSKLLELDNHNLLLIQFYVGEQTEVISRSDMIGVTKTGGLVRAFVDLDRVDPIIKENINRIQKEKDISEILNSIFALKNSKGKLKIAFIKN